METVVSAAVVMRSGLTELRFWRCSRPVEMWHWGSWAVGMVSWAGVGFGNLRCLSQPEWLCNSIILCKPLQQLSKNWRLKQKILSFHSEGHLAVTWGMRHHPLKLWDLFQPTVHSPGASRAGLAPTVTPGNVLHRHPSAARRCAVSHCDLFRLSVLNWLNCTFRESESFTPSTDWNYCICPKTPAKVNSVCLHSS